MVRWWMPIMALLAGAAPAHAQQPMTKEIKAVLQTAATVCVEWASGRADFSESPPPGFREATVFERFGFNIGAAEFGNEVSTVWVGKPGAAVDRWVIGIEDGCIAYTAFPLVPVDFGLMKSTFETLMRRLDPDAPDLEFLSTDEDDEMKYIFYQLDENPDLMVGLGQGWRNGASIRGPVSVIVKRW